MLNEQASIYRRWNPTELDEICGNKIAVAKCRTLIEDTSPSKRPGFYLIAGETGTGKSTLCNILLEGYGCGDIRVFNSRQCGKLDFVTEFLTTMLPNPSLISNSRAFVFEEAHNITAAAQDMFMEPLEKGIPPNTYVVFVTNCPEKLTGGKGALVSRPFRITTINVKPADMQERLMEVNKGEGLNLTEEQLMACARCANGSVRTALNNMSRLGFVPEEHRERELTHIRLDGDLVKGELPPNLKTLAQAVETQDWNKLAPVLKQLKTDGEDPEGLRRGLLAWYAGTMLSPNAFCKKKRAFSQLAIDSLRDNYYNTGFAGLVGDLSHLMIRGIKQ